MSGRVARRMRRERWVVDEVGTVRLARQRVVEAAYDCLVLDRMVPDGDALDLVVELREWPDRPPMLLISAHSDGADRVVALQAGADDFLPKPVHMDEVVVRVDRLNQLRQALRPLPVRLGRVIFDRSRREVLVDGEAVHVTRQEYVVMDYLVAHNHRVAETEEIIDHCWDWHRDVVQNPVHSHITRLRRKFEGVLRFDMVRGQGYIVRVEGDAADEDLDSLDPA